MFDRVLPATVAFVNDRTSTERAIGPLPDEEAIAIARANASRADEFIRGRSCARAALTRLGLSVAAVGVERDRRPRWPVDVVGSITHTNGFTAAAVAWKRDLAGIGIDAENVDDARARISEGTLLATACTSAEREGFLRLGPGQPWGLLAFSAKEAVYKSVDPSAQEDLELTDVVVRLRVDGTFTAASSRIDLHGIAGLWATTATHLFTAALRTRSP